MMRVAFDAVFLVLFSLAVGVPLAGVGGLHSVLAPVLPGWVLWGLAPGFFVVFLLGMIGMLGMLRLLLPPLRPGRYPFPLGRGALTWLAHFALMRVAYLPVWRFFIFSVSTLRWLLVRAFGGRVALDINNSSDVQLLDPGLMHVEQGAMLAAGVLLAGHFVEQDALVLGEVRVARGAQLHGNVMVGPNVVLGPECSIGPECRLAPGVRVGEASHLGGGCVLNPDVHLGDNVVVGHQVTIEAGVEIGHGAVVQSGVRIPKGTRIPDGARYPPRERPDAPARTLHDA